MFVGEKLTNLRELNGLSRKELANELQVTEQAVWQYENEQNFPSIQVVNKLTASFNVDSRYFLTENFLENQMLESKVAYRTEDKESRKKTKFEIVYLNFLDYFISYFEKTVIKPDAIITEIEKKTNHYWMTNTSDKSSKMKKIAVYARQKIGLKQNEDLMYSLEKSGIYIVEKNLGSKIDAYSTISEAGRSFIVLGNVRKTAVRRNFDLAHELGHLLMHANIDKDELTMSEYKDIEHEANNFAGMFLLPEQEFRADFESIRRKSNPDSYIELKRKYLVSIVALEMRAKSLDLMSYQENRYFFGQLTKKGYKAFEPLDDEIRPIRPTRLMSLIKLILDKKAIDFKNLLESFNIKAEFLIELFNLDSNFFDAYIQKKQYFYTGVKVIPMQKE